MNRLEESLKTRVWPKQVRHGEASGYGMECAVTCGRVESRTLRLHQSLSEPIPGGESAITSLCLATGTRIVGATSGQRCHVFCYDPGPQADGVIDAGVIEGARSVRRSLVADADGVVYGGVTETDSGAGGCLFSADSRWFSTSEFHAMAPPIEKRVVPVPGEGVAALAMDPVRRCVYGLSTRTGTFFAYETGSRVLSVKGPPATHGPTSAVLVADLDGAIYGAAAYDRLFSYDPKADRLELLPLALPSLQGRQMYNRWDSGVLDPATGLIYGAGTADGVLFEFNPRARTIKALGKASAEPRVRAMAMGLDGRLYGVAGNEGGMAHLFSYDTASRELADLGILWAAQDAFGPGYEFDAACTGRWGEIYFGESEWDSHLFIYQPPIRGRATGA